MDLPSNRVKRVVFGLALVSLVGTAVLVPIIFSDVFNWGNVSGIFPVLSEPEVTQFYEGEPIKFSVITYQLVSGQFEMNCKEDSDFNSDLEYSWYFQKVGWDSPILLETGVASDELAINSLKPGKYNISVLVQGFSTNYNILDPLDYLSVSRSILPSNRQSFHTIIFEVLPFASLKSWITNPVDYSSIVENQDVVLRAYVKYQFNITKQLELANKTLNIVNNVKSYITKNTLFDRLANNLPEGVSISDIISDVDIFKPYEYMNLLPSQSLTYEWYDEWITENNVIHSVSYLGSGETLLLDSLGKGYHTISLVVNDLATGGRGIDKIRFWISGKEQPTVPFMNRFLDPIVSDSSIFVNWDMSRPNVPKGTIAHYELQLSPSKSSFHPGLSEPYIEGSDYFNVSGTASYYTFYNLTSSTNQSVFEDGRYWFRVRAVDNYGSKSYWSNIEGVIVDQAPVSIYSEGIFVGNGSRIDYHNPGYISYNGITLEGRSGYSSNPESTFAISTFYDLYEGHFENTSLREVYANLTSVQGFVYQYQDFAIRLKAGNASIDEDDVDSELYYHIFSSRQGLIYSGKGFGSQGANISYDNHIGPYLRMKTNDRYSPLILGVHEITILVEDPSHVAYQLSSHLLEVRQIVPLWDTSPRSFSYYFWDDTGDSRSDWGKFGILWNYPQFNPYMPTYSAGLDAEDWENEEDKIFYWEIEITFQYGNYTENQSIIQFTPKPEHFWLDGVSLDDDSLTPYDLTSGNWSFRLRVYDRDGGLSDWSPFCIIVDATNNPLPTPYRTQLPILLNSDNPPPNPSIGFLNTHFYGQYPTVHGGETLTVDARNSSDLNGDMLSYEWYFDDVFQSQYTSDQDLIQLNSEWLGNDINPGVNESDLLDGDDYQDWGLHTITLIISDNVTDVSRTVFVNVLPANVIPSLSGISIDHTRSNPEYDRFLYEWEQVVVYPTSITHIDHDLTPQDIVVEYFATNLLTLEEVSLGYTTIPRSEFLETGSTLDGEYLRERFGLIANLNPGNYRLDISISDSEATVLSSVELSILINQAPLNLKLDLFNDNSIPLPNNDTGKLVLPNQPVIFNISWYDEEPDEHVSVLLIDSIDGVIYDGPGIRNVKSLDFKFFFTTTGLHEVSLVIYDPFGKTNESSSLCYVFNVLNLASEPQPILDELAYTSSYSRYYWEVLYNFGQTDRTDDNVPDPLHYIGDGKEGSPEFYASQGVWTLTPEIHTGAKWIRVWFKLHSRPGDILTISDKTGTVVWNIRMDECESFNEIENGVYQYQSSSNVWRDLPKTQFGDTPDYINFPDYSWKFLVSQRLVFVTLPGDTANFQWKTVGGASTNGYSGYEIAYLEYIGDSPLPPIDPGNAPFEWLEEYLLGMPAMFKTIVENSWNELLKHIDRIKSEVAPFITFKFKFGEKPFQFNIDIRYYLFTGKFRIDAYATVQLHQFEFIQKILGASDLAIEVQGGFRFEFRVSLSEIKMTKIHGFIGIKLAKDFSLLDTLLVLPGGTFLKSILSSVNDLFKKYAPDFAIPESLRFEFQVRGHLWYDFTQEKFFCKIRVSAKATLKIFEKTGYSSNVSVFILGGVELSSEGSVTGFVRVGGRFKIKLYDFIKHWLVKKIILLDITLAADWRISYNW